MIQEIERDPEASQEFERIVRLARFMDEHGTELVRQKESIRDGSRLRTVRPPVFFSMARGARALGVAIVLLSVFVLAGTLMSNKYYRLTDPGHQEPASNVRGQGIEDLAVARRSYSAGSYGEAIRMLERYLRAFPDGGARDYAHLLAGRSWLAASRMSVLGLFRRCDREGSLRAMEHLDAAIALSTNERILDESHLLRAKGFLMLEESGAAVRELLPLERGRSPSSDDARALILQIKQIDPSTDPR